MADAITATVNQADLRAFNAAMVRAEKDTRRNAKDSTIFGSIMFIGSARAPMHKDKTQNKREIQKVATKVASTKKAGKFVKGVEYHVTIKKQNKPDRIKVIRTLSEKDRKGRTIASVPRRGYAYSSWSWMLKPIPKARGKSAGVKMGKPQPHAKRYAKVQTSLGGINPSITLTNKLTYIEKAYPGVVNLALRNATNKMVKNIEEGFGKSVRRANS